MCSKTETNHVNGEKHFSTMKYSSHRPKIYDNVLQLVGKTPLVKLNAIVPKDLDCEIYAKLEYFNPGGSVKDRIALRMLEKAEEENKIRSGKTTIIEPTSGNTGIGLALACAVKGYKCIIVIPEKMSDEKVDTIRALGAHVVRTPTEVASEDSRSNINVALRLSKEIEDSYILDQYNNEENPKAHYEHTAEEILDSMDNNVDMIVFGTGTGGTACGTARRIKEVCRDCLTVGVDPYGSVFAMPPSVNETDVKMYQVEGIGYDFVPRVMERDYIDEWVKSYDRDSLRTSRELIRLEGILCGGSAGAAVWGALQAARRHPERKRIVVILPDSIRNYMTKFLKDQWMEAHGLLDIPPSFKENAIWWDRLVDEKVYRPAQVVEMSKTTNKEALRLLRKHKLPALAVVDYTADSTSALTMVGVYAADAARKRIANHQATFDDQFESFVEKFKYYTVNVDDVETPPTLGHVSRMLDIAPYVFVTKHDSSTSVTTPIGIITAEDLLERIADI